MSTKDQERIKFAVERMNAAQHAMQSGVAQEMSIGSKQADPKQLRVGVNVALVEASAVAKLLMDRGIFTEAEYFEALADAHEAEKKRYETRLTKYYRVPVTLG